jgi:hypothetical protein
MSDSVTVSIGELTIGNFKSILREKRLVISASKLGIRLVAETIVRSRTSSYVTAKPWSRNDAKKLAFCGFTTLLLPSEYLKIVPQNG